MEIPVSVEGGGLYRLLEHPNFSSGCLRWGDLVRTTEPDPFFAGREPLLLEVTELVERLPYPDDQDKHTSGKRHLGLLLDAILDAGGFWQFEELHELDVFIPPDFDVEAWEKGNSDLIASGAYRGNSLG